MPPSNPERPAPTTEHTAKKQKLWHRKNHLEPVFTFDADKYLKKRRIRRTAGYVITLTCGGLATFSLLDMHTNMQNEANAEASMRVVTPAQSPDNQDSAWMTFNGFNTMNADPFLDEMGHGMQMMSDGDLVSAHYDNAKFNNKTIFESAYELAIGKGYESINIKSYSMGDVPAVSVMADFVEKTDIPVESVGIISGPSGYEGLRSYQQDEMKTAQFISKLFPNAKYSTPVRYLLEVYFYRDNYTKGTFRPWNTLEGIDHNFDVIGKNINSFVGVLKGMKTRFDRHGMTSSSFLLEQIYALQKANFDKAFERTAAQKNEKLMPVIYYFGTGEGGYDNVVNDVISGETICGLAHKHGLTCFNYAVPNAQHAWYSKTIEEYEATYAEAKLDVDPAIEQNWINLALARQAVYFADLYPPISETELEELDITAHQ